MKHFCKRFITFTLIIYQNWANCATVCANFMQTVAVKNNEKAVITGFITAKKL